VSVPSGFKAAEKRAVLNFQYYTCNYVVLFLAANLGYALLTNWWLGLALVLNTAVAFVTLVLPAPLPLAARLGLLVIMSITIHALLSTLLALLTPAGLGAHLVSLHAILRPNSGKSRGKDALGSDASAGAHGLAPETLNAFVGSLASDLDDLEARRRRGGGGANYDSAADAEEGRGGGAGAPSGARMPTAQSQLPPAQLRRVTPASTRMTRSQSSSRQWCRPLDLRRVCSSAVGQLRLRPGHSRLLALVRGGSLRDRSRQAARLAPSISRDPDAASGGFVKRAD